MQDAIRQGVLQRRRRIISWEMAARRKGTAWRWRPERARQTTDICKFIFRWRRASTRCRVRGAWSTSVGRTYRSVSAHCRKSEKKQSRGQLPKRPTGSEHLRPAFGSVLCWIEANRGILRCNQTHPLQFLDEVPASKDALSPDVDPPFSSRPSLLWRVLRGLGVDVWRRLWQVEIPV